MDPVFEAFRATAGAHPDRVALRMVGDTDIDALSYGALLERCEERSRELAALGLRPGDRVIFAGANRPEWLACWFGAADRGLTTVPLDPKLTDAQLRELVGRVAPSLALLDPEHAARFAGLFPALPLRSLVDLAPLSARADVGESPADPDPSVALVIFTSGATALPKGAMLGRDNLDAAFRAAIAGFELTPDSEVLCVLPFFHVLGLGAAVAPLLAGGGVSFLSELRGDLLLGAMARTGTTILPGPPRLFELILSSIRTQVELLPAPKRALVAALRGGASFARTWTPLDPAPVLFRSLHARFGGRLKLLFSGGAPLPGAVREGLEAYGFRIVEGYGMTETSAGVSMNTALQHRAGSVGRALPGIDVRLAHPDVTGQGELQVRGPTVMRGYLGDPEASAAAFSDGWLRTGDLARIDPEGFIRITGRIKELIVTSSGKKTSPDEVQALYAELPGVAELAVLGMPARTGHGEEVHAAAVLAPGATAAAVQAAIEERSAGVPAHQRIQRLHVVDSIPRTTTLKVRRQALRAELEGAHPDAPAPAAAPAAADRVGRVVAEVQDLVGDRVRVEPASSLGFDLGIDSMGLLDLAGRLEARFGVAVRPAQLQGCARVADLVALLDQPAPAAAEALEIAVPAPRSAPSVWLLGVARRVLGFLWGLRFEGLEHVPASGPFLLCPNHGSHVDSLLVAAGLPAPHQAGLCVFSKQEHFESGPMRLVTRWLRAIPVDRTGDASGALETGRRYLSAARPLLVHPEGTRSRDGRLLPFRRGAAHLARKAAVPLVPVYIEGSHALYPPHQSLPPVWWRGRPLVVRFGPPILPAAEGSEQELTDELRRRIVALGAT